MKNDSASFFDIFLPALKGFAVSVAVSSVLLFSAAALLCGSGDPDSLMRPVGIAILYIAAGVGGVLSAVLSHEYGAGAAVVGAVSGVILLVFVTLFSFLPTEAPKNVIPAGMSIALHAMIPAVSAGTATIFRRKKKRRRRRR